MAGDPKWIDGVTAETPLVEAAKMSFDARFSAVDDTWTAALDDVRNPENIHDLRVATRRAAAALRIFGDLLSRRTADRLERLLQKLRRAAGKARDEDVFAEHLEEKSRDAEDGQRAGYDWLAGAAAKRVAAARHAVLRTARHRDKWNRLIADATPRSKCATETLASRAKAYIPKRMNNFQAAAMSRIEQPDRLHELRIAGKRLRYSLELLGPATPASDHMLHAIQKAQDILGDAHDSRTIADRLNEQLTLLDASAEHHQGRYRSGIMAWKNELEQEVAAGPIQFRNWQRQWQVLLAATQLPQTATASKRVEK